MGNQQQQVYVFATQQFEALLTDNETDLVELLRREGQEVTRAVAANPAANDQFAEREPVSVLLASAGLVLALTPILSRAIRALTERPITVTEMVCVPVEDSSGNVVRDASGQPVLHWIERTRWLETKGRHEPTDRLAVEGPLGIKLSYSNETKE